MNTIYTSLQDDFCIVWDVEVLHVLHVLKFVRESGFTEKTVDTAGVATIFKVRRILGDFNARLSLIEQYRKYTLNSDVADALALIKGCVI